MSKNKNIKGSDTGIYKITSPSGKVYIGQSRELHQRRKYYKYISVKRQPAIFNSLLKYGFDNHNFEIICDLPKDIDQVSLNQYEELYWQFYKDCGITLLNISKPGNVREFSEETKLKMKANWHKNNPPRKCFQYDLNGKFIKEFSTVKVASDELDIDIANIHRCMKEEQKSANGFIFRKESTNVHPTRIRKNVQVLQFDKFGNLVNSYKNASEASRSSNINISNIVYCAKGKRQSAGSFVWKYENSDYNQV